MRRTNIADFDRYFHVLSRPSITYVLMWIALLVAFVLVCLSVAVGRINPQQLINSDTLFFPVLFEDLEDGGRFAAWNLPPNPYFFPDALLFLVADLLFVDIRSKFIFAGIAQVALCFLGWSLVQRTLFGFTQETHALLLLTATVLLLFIATGAHAHLILALNIVTHFGVMVVVPYVLLLLIQIMRRERNLRASATDLMSLSLLSSMTAFSDTLFIVQCALPAVLALGFLSTVNRKFFRKAAIGVTVLVGSVVVGHLLRRLLPGESDLNYYVRIHGDRLASAIRNFTDWFTIYAQSHPILTFLWLVSIAALMISCALSVRRNARTQDETLQSVLFVDLVLLISAAGTLAATLATGNFTNVYDNRYLLPLTFLPLLVAVPYLLNRRGAMVAVLQKQHTQLALAATLVALVTFAVLMHPHQLADLSVAYSDSLVTCLDEQTELRNLDAGLAHYWQAMYVSQLSQRDLKLVQVKPDITPFHWNNSIDWYRDDFDFIVLDLNAETPHRIHESRVIEMFGPPADEFICMNSLVYVYNRPQDLLFQKWMSLSPELASFQHVGDIFEFSGARLPALTGSVVGLSRVASEGAGDAAGILTYASRTELQPGDYIFEIHYYADSANTGAWDVVLHQAKREQILREGLLDRTGKGVASGSFHVSRRASVDIRTYYDGHGKLYIDRIRLKRLGGRETAHVADQSMNKIGIADVEDLRLLSPAEGSTISSPTIDFFWWRTGPPLTENQAFEIRIWHADDPAHFGAHDAQYSDRLIRQIDDFYTASLTLNGVHSIAIHGPGEYRWSVAIVEINPTYRDLDIESAPNRMVIGGKWTEK